MDVFDTNKVSLSIHVDNPVVFPGSTLTGALRVKTQGPVDAIAIRLKAVGKEFLQRRVFDDDGGGGRRQQQHSALRPSSENKKTMAADAAASASSTQSAASLVTERHCIWKQLITLWGQLKDAGRRDASTIPTGEYSYPFEFTLPLQTPPSFSIAADDAGAGGDAAAIRYYLKAYVDVSLGRDARVRQPFLVLCAMPARQWREQCPMSMDRSWDVTRCGCCGSLGKLQCRLEADRTVFAADRDVVVGSAEIDNTRCEVPVERATMRLIAKSRVRIQNQSSYIERCCGTVTENVAVAPGQRGSVSLSLLFSPAQCPPALASHRVQTTYEIQLALDVPYLKESDACHAFPALVSHTVDDQNVQLPVNTNACVFPNFDENARKEYFYAPAAKPVTAPRLIPAASYKDVAAHQAAATNCPYQVSRVTAFPDPSLWGAPLVAGAGNAVFAIKDDKSNENDDIVWALPEAPLRTVERSGGCGCGSTAGVAGSAVGGGRGGTSTVGGCGTHSHRTSVRSELAPNQHLLLHPPTAAASHASATPPGTLTACNSGAQGELAMLARNSSGTSRQTSRRGSFNTAASKAATPKSQSAEELSSLSPAGAGAGADEDLGAALL